MEHPDKHVREAERQIIQVLKELEKQTGMVIADLEFREIDGAPKFLRIVNIRLAPSNSIEREFIEW